jgi:DNA-binding transcriptional LysR family regulator
MSYILPMNEVHLGAFDLNLLVALDALLTEGSVTRAAVRIGITQSAASHALSRLRRLTGDELLVRGRDGMVPTIRAEAMRAPLRRALDDITGTLSSARAFDPKTARLRAFIGASDYAELVLLPGIMARLVSEAPGVEVRVLMPGQDPASELAAGKLDFVIMPSPPVYAGQGIRGRQLLSDRFVCIARRGHPLAKTKTLTLSSFAGAAHALISPWGMEGGYVDDALARLGLQRKVAVAVPHFLVAPHIVASSDLLLTVAERVAEAVAGPLGLVVLAPPKELELTGFTLSILWHERTHEDPARRWLRNGIVAEANQRSRTAPVVSARWRAPQTPKAKAPGHLDRRTRGTRAP